MVVVVDFFRNNKTLYWDQVLKFENFFYIHELTGFFQWPGEVGRAAVMTLFYREIKVQRDEATCPKSHSKSVEWSGLNPGPPASRASALCPVSYCPESETSFPH